MDKFIVIKDSREKEGKGWQFNKSKYCDGMVVQKLDTGDYSLSGYEDVFTIERKQSVTEFAHNVIEKRFDREIVRMQDIQHAFILLEFNMSELLSYPTSAKIPRAKLKLVKLTGDYVLRRMCEIMIQNPNIKIIPCGPKGKEVARSLFKRITQNDI